MLEALKLLPTLPLWAALILVVGVIVGSILRSSVPIFEIRAKREESEAARLVAELGELRKQFNEHQAQALKERQRLEDKIESQRLLYESKLETERARHEAQEAYNRHKIRNLETCFTLFFSLAERLPTERLPEIVIQIREMRAEQVKAEAAESAALNAGRLMLAAPAASA